MESKNQFALAALTVLVPFSMSCATPRFDPYYGPLGQGIKTPFSGVPKDKKVEAVTVHSPEGAFLVTGHYPDRLIKDYGVASETIESAGPIAPPTETLELDRFTP